MSEPAKGAEYVDSRLKEWATPTQLKYIDAANTHRSFRAAGKALGVDGEAVRKAIRALEAKAATKGFNADHALGETVPDPYILKGTSALWGRNKDTGEPEEKLRWVKTKLDDELRMGIIVEAFANLAAEAPRLEPVPKPRVAAPDLLTLYPMTDCHVGMLAWGKEAGEPWDLKIAERTLTGAFQYMVDTAPAAGTAVIWQGGDWLHFDGLLPVTPTHGHVLDADGRFSKVVQASIRILRRLCDAALAKHKRVVIIMGEGNHDMASSVWLRHMFGALYEREPRLTVMDSELPYYVHQHGKVMLAFHHGHLKKNAQLPGLFAASHPTVWGSTTKRFAHVGHRHHVELIEHPGMKVEQHATIAAKDAHAARGGWLSERQVQSITYHCERGEMARFTVTPEMLAA